MSAQWPLNLMHTLSSMMLCTWGQSPRRVACPLCGMGLSSRPLLGRLILFLDFLPSEAVAVGRTLEVEVAKQATERQIDGGRAGGQPSGKLPEGSRGGRGDRMETVTPGLSGWQPATNRPLGKENPATRKTNARRKCGRIPVGDVAVWTP